MGAFVGISLLVGSLGVLIWLLRPVKPDPPPSPDEYWADREADERARRGIE